MQKTAYVTGSTGFLGINIVGELLNDGWQVIALRRKSSNTRDLDTLPVTQVEGDVLDVESLRRTMPERVDAVFHVAADTGMWSALDERQNRINIDGTRNVVAVALEKQIGRFIHTSSLGAFGTIFNEEITEETPSRALQTPINYYRSKYLAEQEVLQAIAKGLDAVIINPAQIIGPYDYNYTPVFFTTVRDGRMMGVPPGNSVAGHVRDYARAHVSAYSKGRKGERYLLGGVHVTFEELFTTVGDIIGKQLPFRFRLPPVMLDVTAAVMEFMARFTGKEPLLTPEKVALLKYPVIVNSSKAERELGFSTCSLREMLEDSYKWMKEAGLA